MPNDIADWSSSVVVQSGTVSITGIATVTISGTPAVSISGTPTVNVGNTPAVTINSGTVNIGNTPTVILGTGTASIGSISAIGSTVTVAGTINIGNTPAVTISGTPSVTISSGTVSIGNVATMNVQTANGVAAVGPNLLPLNQGGPITAGWIGNGVTVAYFGNGQMRLTEQSVNPGNNYAQNANAIGGAYGLIPVRPGETYFVSAAIKALSAAKMLGLNIFGFDGGGNIADNQGVAAQVPAVLNSYVSLAGTYRVPDNGSVSGQPVYYIAVVVVVDQSGTGTVGDVYEVSRVTFQHMGAFPVNAQQETLQVGHPWDQVLSGQTGGTGSGSFTTLPVERDAQQLMLIIVGPTAADGYFGISVKGVQTGNFYLPQTNASQAVTGMVTVPINGIADKTFLIAFTGATTASTITLFAYESSMPPGYPGLGQQQGAASLPVVIASDQTPITVHPWIYSQFQHSVTGSGVQASVTFAAFAGRQWVATALVASMTAIAAASVQTDVRVKDGTTDIWVVGLGFGSGSGFTDRWSSERLAINGSTNTSMTFEFIAGIVNVVERINAGAYAVSP